VNKEEVLAAAIAKEEHAQSLYAGTAAKADNPAVKALLLDLAGQEASHKELLAELDPAELDAFRPDSRSDLKIAEYLRERPLSETANLQEVRTYAMKRELEAREFYALMAEAVDDDVVGELFARLARAENAHKARLEETYSNLFLREA